MDKKNILVGVGVGAGIITLVVLLIRRLGTEVPQCKEGYVWDETILACVPKTSDQEDLPDVIIEPPTDDSSDAWWQNVPSDWLSKMPPLFITATPIIYNGQTLTGLKFYCSRCGYGQQLQFTVCPICGSADIKKFPQIISAGHQPAHRIWGWETIGGVPFVRDIGSGWYGPSTGYIPTTNSDVEEGEEVVQEYSAADLDYFWEIGWYESIEDKEAELSQGQIIQQQNTVDSMPIVYLSNHPYWTRPENWTPGYVTHGHIFGWIPKFAAADGGHDLNSEDAYTWVPAMAPQTLLATGIRGNSNREDKTEWIADAAIQLKKFKKRYPFFVPWDQNESFFQE